MNFAMQLWNISKSLAGSRVNSEMVDLHAQVDRRLTYGENLRNIQAQYGIQTRNYGIEQMEQRRHEQERNRQARADPFRQTGRIQTEAGRLMDMRFQAMPPGRRISDTGHLYYERRENRSDRSRNRRL